MSISRLTKGEDQMTSRMMRAAAVTALLALFGAAKANEQWAYEQTVDDFTDEKKSRAFSPNMTGDPYRYAGLRVGCNESDAAKGRVSSWVNLGYFNHTGADGLVEVRFDNDEPKPIFINEWSGTHGFNFTHPSFLSESEMWGSLFGMDQFILQLMHKSRLRIQTHYYNHGPVVLDFSLKGAAEAIGKVLDDCNAVLWVERARTRLR